MKADVRLDRAATLFIDGVLPRFWSMKSEAAIPVLMYHSVSDDPEAGVRPYYRLTTSPRRFLEHMRWLADNGYSAIGLDDAVKTSHSRRSKSRRVVITFDDGLLDVLENAWPVLESFGFTATVFLPTAFIGETRQRFKGRQCLTWSEVRALSGQGVCFGSHTVTHPVLHGLAWCDLRNELRESRHRIEAALSRSVTAFAYPYAFPQEDHSFVSRFCRELHEQGYTTGVTTSIGRFDMGDDPLRIRRLPLNECDDISFFRAKLAGAYDWVGLAQSVWKRGRWSSHAG
jgi:peptidoglycan/xylan/chitin deacetylase (PgdA/CDA1 family)